MTEAEKFFYEHAGYSYRPGKETEEEGRQRGAVQLAWAEEQLRVMQERKEWLVAWEIDEGADPFDWDGEGRIGEEAWGCVIEASVNLCRRVGLHTTHLASLWGIWDPPEEYKRVVEAELALEVLHTQAGVER